MRKDIRDEINKIAPLLADVGNQNNYRVPVNYFEDFAGEVMSNIQLPSTELPFAAPSPAYFEGLAGSILDKIKSSNIVADNENEVTKELSELSPLLAAIKKTNVYAAPADYFATFKVQVPAAVQKGKLVTMRPTRWKQFAAAAVIAGIIATGGLFFFKNDKGTISINSGNYSARLSKVSNDEITNYLNESPVDMDITPSSYDDSKVNPASLTKQLLNDVSNDEINEYLQENQEPDEKDSKGI